MTSLVLEYINCQLMMRRPLTTLSVDAVKVVHKSQILDQGSVKIDNFHSFKTLPAPFLPSNTNNSITATSFSPSTAPGSADPDKNIPQGELLLINHSHVRLGLDQIIDLPPSQTIIQDQVTPFPTSIFPNHHIHQLGTFFFHLVSLMSILSHYSLLSVRVFPCQYAICILNSLYMSFLTTCTLYY